MAELIDIDTTCIGTGNIDIYIDQLSDENKHYLLGVLEALIYAQNMREMPIEKGVIQGNE